MDLRDHEDDQIMCLAGDGLLVVPQIVVPFRPATSGQLNLSFIIHRLHLRLPSWELPWGSQFF